MKRILICLSAFLLLTTLSVSAKGRKQWTEKQAWAWQEKVGVLKGFNQPEAAYPGMTRDEMLRRASELGLNAVRFWAPCSVADQAIKFISEYAADAEKYGIRLQPVIAGVIHTPFDKREATEQELQACKDTLQKIIRAFRNDPRIISYDIWNEPGNFGFDPGGDAIFIRHLNCIAKMAEWCYEENPSQAISSSIFWRGDIMNEPNKPASKLACEVEAMMDVHNIHQYNAGDEHSRYFARYIDYVQTLGHRPVLSTECLTRVNNSGLGRTLPTYAKKNVNFFLWGLYICDANWDVRWGRSTYDAYEPGFHNLMHPDGDLIDYRDVELIRNYEFTDGKDVDPGSEFTDRWEVQRAWKWMVSGPVKGKVFKSVDDARQWLGSEAEDDGTNSINVFLNYAKFKKDAKGFLTELASLLDAAGKLNITVMPTLLTDETATGTDEELASYVEKVITRFYTDARIQAWDLYYHPGEKNKDGQQLEARLKKIFSYARFAFPNQPVMSTPWVFVKPFKADFKYREALLHGRRNGWNLLDYNGGSSAYLTQLIWRLSDVIAFSSSQSDPQCGWLKSICYRYGRPIFCTNWQPQNEKDAQTSLHNFAQTHVFWYQQGESRGVDAGAFRFIPINTRH